MINLLISVTLLFSFQPSNPVETLIKDKLTKSTGCWNSGDMECFMQTYWKSDALKFIGGKGVTYGWTNTLERYKVGYPTEKERGILTFSFLSFEQLSDDACFLVGKYHLAREVGDDTGHFSLLWRKIEGEWLITTDHSSGE